MTEPESPLGATGRTEPIPNGAGVALDHDALTALRKPFAPNQIGKLPRVTCKDCRNSSAKCCDKHAKRECGECGNWMTERHLHLDYVGHAQVTDRLLDVDPGWSWEPVAWDASGFPAIIEEQNGRRILWIKLTVCGVTRLGVGIVNSAKDEVEKELIGDGIRNAGMRFGIALDLWAKGDLHADEPEPASPEPPPVDWPAIGWPDGKEEYEAAFGQNRARSRSLNSAHQDQLRKWMADQNFAQPYERGQCDAWADRIEELVADETAPASDPATESVGDPTLLDAP